MKRIILFSLLMTLVLGACATPPTPDDQKLTVTVSILPQKWFADQIGGDRIRTQAMVGSGDDPHTYEPSPQQMTALADSDLYFTIGVEFEEVWMPRFETSNPAMKVVDSAEGIERIPADLDSEIKRMGERFSREWVRSVGNEANDIFVPYYLQ